MSTRVKSFMQTDSRNSLNEIQPTLRISRAHVADAAKSLAPHERLRAYCALVPPLGWQNEALFPNLSSSRSRTAIPGAPKVLERLSGHADSSIPDSPRR